MSHPLRQIMLQNRFWLLSIHAIDEITNYFVNEITYEFRNDVIQAVIQIDIKLQEKKK